MCALHVCVACTCAAQSNIGYDIGSQAAADFFVCLPVCLPGHEPEIFKKLKIFYYE